MRDGHTKRDKKGREGTEITVWGLFSSLFILVPGTVGLVADFSEQLS